MKKMYFLLALLTICGGVLQAQTVTSLGGLIVTGTTAGSTGNSSNAYFGHQAGTSVTTGVNNTFVGLQSGQSTTTGYENSALGSLTLQLNTTGARNTANGIYALYGNTSGIENTGIGYSTLGFNTSGSGNIAAGTRALLQNTAGNYNSAIGYEALQNNFNSNYNTAVGYRSGQTNTNGSQNTFLGSESGLNNLGSNNIFIGYQAGYNEAGSNRLYIDNSNTATPLIWGDFANNLLNFNGNVGIGTESPSEALQVTGNVRFSGALMPNNAAGSGGQVLTSAGAGVAPTWTSLPISVNSLNGLTAAAQTFATGTAGTDFGISSSGTTHTFNLPSASAANRGLVTAADWTTFNNKANINAPNFTGIPTAPTAAAGTNTTQIATTGFVTTADNLKANINSPTFTGTPAAPTAAAGTNTTQLATTAFVTTADNLKANLASPNFTGTPTAPTAAAGTNTIQLATTAFVTAAVSGSNTFPSYPASAGDGGGTTNAYFGHEAGLANTGTNNTFSGYRSGFSNTIATNNTAYGYQALRNNTTASYNTAVGMSALYTQSFANGGMTYSTGNVAVGYEALYSNQPLGGDSGSWNTAVGARTLRSNTTGYYNTAIGAFALEDNTDGSLNNASGVFALTNNTTGSYNTATGHLTLASNTTSSYNTAHGYRALTSNTLGEYNAAGGYYSLDQNLSGSNNTAYGANALNNNSSGNNNTAIGRNALFNNTTGSYNTALGSNAGPNAGAYTNTTAIGYNTITTASNQVRIGNDAVTSIGGFVAWSNVSDGRFKKNVREDVAGLTFIEQLRPVSYEMDVPKLNEFIKSEEVTAPATDESNPLSPKTSAVKTTQPPTAEADTPKERVVGFVAQEVEQLIKDNGYVFSGVEKPQNERDHYSIRYAEFVVPLVKAVQELSAKENAQRQRIETLEQELETLKSVVYGSPTKIPGASGKTTAQSEPQALPDGFALYQNVPNPFNTTTVIAARLPESVQQAKIVVYNLQGLELAGYPLSERGRVSVEISGGRFPAGMYLYALLADGQVIDTKKMVLTK